MSKKIEIQVDVDSGSVDITSNRVLTLTEQLRILKKEIQKVGPGAEQDLLIGKFNEVNDELDKTNLKSKEFLGALGTLPGPVGQFAGSLDGAVNQLRNFSSFSLKDIKAQLKGLVDDFGKIASNLGKATGITKIYTTLNNALAASFVKVGVGEAAAATGARAFAAALTATGIGALVVGLGMAISYLMDYADAAEKAAEKQKELNEAADKMAKETLDVETQSVKRQGDLLLASEKARGASAKRIYELEQQNRELLLNAQKRYYNSLSNLDDEEGRRTLQTIKNTQNEIKVAEQNFKAEQLKENQAKNDKIAQNNKSADEILLNLQRENAVLSIQDERKRQDEELKNAKLAEEDKIKALDIDKKRQGELLLQVKTKYDLKQADIDKKRNEEDAKKREDFLEKIKEIEISAEKDLTEMAVKERQNRFDKDKKELDQALKDKIISQQEYNNALINLEKAKDKEIEKIRLEAKLREEQIAKGDRDALFVRMMAASQMDLDAQRQLLEEKKKRDDTYYSEQLSREGLTTEQIRDLNDRKLQDQIQYTEKSNQIERDRVSVRQKAFDDIISIVGAESDLGRAAFIAKQILMAKELIMEVKRTITFSKLTLARSTAAVAEGTAQTAKVGFPQNIPLLIGYAAQAAGIISAVISATKAANEAGKGGGETAAPAGNDLGRNYESGGMINGPRHAQGGVMVEAEGGEAIMTRGAVTMFAPLLSAMNQMGGGTSFGNQLYIRPDAAAVSKPAQDQSPMIMKTYVVSNELTSEQEKLARLKDLSTL